MEHDPDLAEALALHRGGRLDEAAARYEAIAAGRPDDADLLGLMGILDQQRGALTRAAARLDRALAMTASDAVQVRNLNARAILARRVAAAAGNGHARAPAGSAPADGVPGGIAVLLRHARPAAPLDPPGDAATAGAYVSLASLAMLAGEAALAGDLSAAVEAAAATATPAQRTALVPVLAALGRLAGLEAVAALAGDAEARRTLWIAARSAALSAGRGAIAAEATRRLLRDHPVLVDRRQPPGNGAPGDGAPGDGALRVLVLHAPFDDGRTESTLYHGGAMIAEVAATYRGGELAFDGCLLGRDADVDAMALPAVDVIFNNVATAEVGIASGTYAQAEALAARLGVPMLNPPGRLVRTTRVDTGRHLAGIEGLVLPRAAMFRHEGGDPGHLADSIALKVGLPVIIRAVGRQMGQDMHLCHTAEELRARLAHFAGRHLNAIEYVETRRHERLWPKYRVAFIDGAMFGNKLMFAEQWKVHAKQSDVLYLRRSELNDEADRFVHDPAGVIGEGAAAVLKEIDARLGLDFFGIDFGFDRAGRVVLFEANAAMLGYPSTIGPGVDPYRAHRARIQEAFCAMLIRAGRQGRAARAGAGS
ncbi:MAG: hypothetical protein AAFR52_02420 [Pseudomonadota bacterium]